MTHPPRRGGLVLVALLALASAIAFLASLAPASDGRPLQWPDPPRETSTHHETCLTVRCVIRSVFGRHAAAATRVARCESRLDPHAVSPTGDYGLFQINRRYHAWAFAGHDIFDPVWNSRVAYSLSSGGRDWRPWTCRWAA